MICKIKARRSKSVDLSRPKHLWCSGNTIVFQTVVDGSSPSRCSRDPDSNSTVCKTAGIAPSQVRILSGSIRGVVSELVKGGGPHKMDLDLAIAYLFSGTLWVRSQMENRKMTMLIADDRQ